MADRELIRKCSMCGREFYKDGNMKICPEHRPECDRTPDLLTEMRLNKERLGRKFRKLDDNYEWRGVGWDVMSNYIYTNLYD